MVEWNQRAMSVVQPLLDYLAPEYVIGGRCDPYADIFSLGIMALTVFNGESNRFTIKIRWIIIAQILEMYDLKLVSLHIIIDISSE